MKFCWCTLKVQDLDASLEFYETVLGLKLNGRFESTGSMEIAFLGEGDTKVELTCDHKNEKSPSCEGISLGFETNNLDDAMNFVHSKGIKISAGPFSPNPHTRFFFVQDPDGYNIQFVENS